MEWTNHQYLSFFKLVFDKTKIFNLCNLNHHLDFKKRGIFIFYCHRIFEKIIDLELKMKFLPFRQKNNQGDRFEIRKLK